MKRYLAMVLVLALSAWVTACGSSSAPAGDVLEENADDQVFWPDNGTEQQQPEQAEEEQAPVACTSDAECLQKMSAPAACKTWKCDSKANACVSADLDNGLDCDDHNACTEHDKCLNGVCLGDGVSCDDNNACTSDSCNANTGCAHEDNSAACNDGDQCTLNDHCQGGQCTGDQDPKCVCTTDEDCKPFDDGDLCNGVKVCLGSQCVTKEGSVKDCSGVAAGPCEKVACNPVSGECQKSFKTDGVECTDGSFCTINDACKGGQCLGTALKCDDGNACTDDECDPGSGCTNANNTEPCDDGKLCTSGDACKDGACAGTVNPECQCDSDAACAAFDDGDLCNGTMKCLAGACQADPDSVVKCDPAPAGGCEDVYCEAATGQCKTKHALNGTKCDDGDQCTSEGACADGTCVVTAVNCDDGNLCTDDGCEKATGCTHANNTKACDDGNTCTSGDACKDGACQGTADQACDCVINQDCQDDGNLCNGVPSCVSGQCVVDPATRVLCPESQGCVVSTCEPKTGACVESQAADGTLCDDGDKCTDKDLCQAGACKPGNSVVCDDANLCTDDSCDPTAGCVHAYNAVECDDGNACSTNDHCAEGACTGTPAATCVCEQPSDCAAYDDGNPCNGTLACVEHKCVADPAGEVVCPAVDPDGCKLSYCEPATGLCVNPDLPDGKPCDDHDACTLVDVCQAGVCTTSGTPACVDDNPCTDDSCDPATGCVFAYNNIACDDGDPCTEGDSCMEGVCQPGPTNTCAPSCQADWTLECGDFDAWSTVYPGATSNVDGYSCNSDLYSGPEYTYRFTAPYNGTLTVYLTDEADETDVLVLDDLGAGCNTANCRAFGYSTVEVPMVAGQAYYFVVDGFMEAAGEYTIHVNCAPDHEVNCADGQDDDLDGLIDCLDEADCLGTPECPIPECTPDWTLTCGGSDTWWNYGAGSTDLLQLYSCTAWTYEGPEYTYSFVAPATGDVTISLSNLDADLDVVVLTAGGAGECLASACVAFSDQASTIDESVTFAATEGATYYIVVDGFMGAESGFTVTLDCPGGPVETACAPAAQLQCGDVVSGNNGAVGSTNLVNGYSCTEEPYFSPEYVYTFVPTQDALVAVDLTDETDQTDVLVLTDNGACDPAACLAWDMYGAVFEAKANQTYYIVVDGWGPDNMLSVGDYTLTVSCAQ